jgi:hypothetical protein
LFLPGAIGILINMKSFDRAVALMIIAWFLFVNVLFFWQRFEHSSIIGRFLGR